MSLCIGTRVQCSCMRARVKWCLRCNKWICRWYIDWHDCQIKQEKELCKQILVALLQQRIKEQENEQAN